MESSKEITALIDTKNIIQNIDYLRRKTSTEIMAVLKANAFGHGIIGISNICRLHGIQYIGVATLFEALLLRKSGDNGKILVFLYSITNPQLKFAINHYIELTLFNEAYIEPLSKLIPKGKKCNIHIFVDTGFNRTGIPYNKIAQTIKQLQKHANKFNIVGLMSHVVKSDTKNDSFVNHQLKLFQQIKQIFQDNNIAPAYIHIANTNTALNYDITGTNMARIGRGLFGLTKDKNLQFPMTLTSKIIQIKQIKKGETIGYDRTYTATKKMKIVVIPIGYADVLPNNASAHTHVWIHGTKRKVLGLENMDQIVVEGKAHDKLNDNVVIFDDYKTVQKLAEIANMKDIELLTHLGNRIKYKYI